ncbi:cystatin-B-like [Epinephelus fuscoguttatus]|uniref:cystatin-B-like n=1 Tax=Epinephelus fuscoguttatus TaxID=293821 RepID=UPI0020D15D0E|nr:cystatin-B-like [Epinephelus fuscoguttatus]
MATGMGKWSETKDATEGTQKICDQVKDQVEKQTGKKYRVYTAVKYRIQIMAGGTNYLIKVDVGEDYDHLSVNQPLVGYQVSPSLSGVEQHQTKDAPLMPFVN